MPLIHFTVDTLTTEFWKLFAQHFRFNLNYQISNSSDSKTVIDFEFPDISSELGHFTTVSDLS